MAGAAIISNEDALDTHALMRSNLRGRAGEIKIMGVINRPVIGLHHGDKRVNRAELVL